MTKAAEDTLDEGLVRKSYNLDLKSIQEDGSFCGYGSVFGVVDFYNEVVEAGAFKKSLKEHAKEGRMPSLLWQHDAREPIGIFTKMKEDEHGLYVEGKLLIAQNVPHADKAYSLLKAGALTGLSIGFMTKKYRWDEEKRIRYLTEIELWETSLVTFPANGASRITAVRSLDGVAVEKLHLHKRGIEAALRDGGASNSVAQYIASLIPGETPALRDEGGEKRLQCSIEKAINILKG